MRKNYILILVCLALCIGKLKAQCPVTITASDTVICSGNTVSLIAGGGAMTYSWSTGASSQSITLAPTSTTVYTLTGSISTCTSSATVTITVNPTPTVTVNSSVNVCAGGTATLTASGATTYIWAPAINLSNTTGSLTTFTNATSSITYTVTGTSPNGCISTATVGVFVSPAISLSVTTTPSACYPCNGSASITGVTGGSPPYMYAWNGGSPSTTATSSSLCQGSYSVIVTDANGCIANDTVTIGTTASPTLTLTESSSTICAGDSATLSATGAVNYFWYPYNSLNDSLISTVIAKPTVTTTYTITGYDANSCSTMAYLTLSVTPTPTVGFIMQRDTTTTGVWFAYPSYSSSVTNATWYWGDGTSSTGLSPSHTYTAAAHYNICVTAFNSCGDSANTCQNDSLYRLSQNSSNMISVTVIDNSTTGINQVNVSNKQLLIYPNPSTGNFTIETNTSVKQTLQIVDINGRVVLTQIINSKANIDAGNLNEGVYNISIFGNEGVTNKRLVIAK